MNDIESSEKMTASTDLSTPDAAPDGAALLASQVERVSPSGRGTRSDSSTAIPVAPRNSAFRGLSLSEVHLRGGFWGSRQETNSAATLAHIEYWQEREGWIANFDLAAAGTGMSDRRGREFSDSEIYKLLEAMAWELGRRPDRGLEARFATIVGRIAAAQEPDGYIGTRFGRPGQPPRYSDLEWGHELYCQGHLMQAAVARLRTGHGDDLLVAVAKRSADHICETFGEGGIESICGHSEVEVGLAELGRALDEPRYTEMARVFVERHGLGSLDDIEFGRAYYQDDQPVRQATVFRGHAVRANYLAAAAVDVAVDTHDHDLLRAVVSQWATTQARRTYITGGQGSQHQDEGFGPDFVLPPDRAYSETCAAIASNMVSWRLLLETGEPQYADSIERCLFNVIATSPGEDGRSFYYANTLHQRVPGEPADPHHASARAQSSLRAPWFDVSCCPPNVARTLASLAAYTASVSGAGLQVHQFASMTIDTELFNSRLLIEVDTDYPASGSVMVTVVHAPSRDWEFSIRIPTWSASAVLVLPDGERREFSPGMASVQGLKSGDVLTLELDVSPRFVAADPRIDAVRGTVAVVRGPEVWCLESVDLPLPQESADVALVRVDPTIDPRMDGDLVLVRAQVRVAPDNKSWPYGEEFPIDDARVGDVALVPYHGWARRGPTTMRVWIPVVDQS